MSQRPPPTVWPDAGGDPSLVAARLQIHHAAQLLAAFAGACIEPRDDDSHRSLSWVPGQQALATGSKTRGDGAVSVHLAIAAMTLQVLRGDRVQDGFELRGRTLAEARSWLVERVSPGAAPTALPWPEFEIPAHPVAQGQPFDVEPAGAARVAGWFQAAAWALAPVASREDAGPLRCWPHHFDIATLITAPTAGGDSATPTVGVGMSPGDGAYSAPYGYVSPWPPPWDAPRPALDHGHWHTEGWLGAVLPSSAWVSNGGPSTVEAFFAQAIEASLGLLS